MCVVIIALFDIENTASASTFPSLPFPPLKSNTCVTEIYNIVTSFSYVYGAHVCGLNIHVRGVLYKIVFIVLLKKKKSV